MIEHTTIAKLRATIRGADCADVSLLDGCDDDDPVELTLIAAVAARTRGGYQSPQIHRCYLRGRAVYVAVEGYPEGYRYDLYTTAQAAFDVFERDQDAEWVCYGDLAIPWLVYRGIAAQRSAAARQDPALHALLVELQTAAAKVVVATATARSHAHVMASAWLSEVG